MRDSKRDRDCGCGCNGSGACSTRRDEPNPAAPPSSRRGERIGYRFATASALVRGARMTPEKAQRVVSDFSRYVRYRMLEGKSPESTAAHLVRFEEERLVRPPRARARRDPAPRRSSKRASKIAISERGNPFKLCPRGTRPEALMFPLELFTARSATAWARKRGFPIRKVEETKNFIRIRVAPTNLFTPGSFRNIPMSKRFGVRLIIGCPRFEAASKNRDPAADYGTP